MRQQRRDEAAYLRLACDNAARAWVMARAPENTKEYVYVEKRWVLVTICHNGEEEAAPRRRADDKESDFLAPKEDT